MLSRNFTLLALSLVAASCLKRQESRVERHVHEGNLTATSAPRPYIVTETINSIFVDNMLNKTGKSLLAGSVINVSRITDDVYSFPTLDGPRYFEKSYLPSGSRNPKMSTNGTELTFTDISGTKSHKYSTPTTLPKLIRDADTKDKKLIILYLWSVCYDNDVCTPDTEHLSQFQNDTPEAQVFSVYIDYSHDNETDAKTTVRNWREKRDPAQIPFPVLWAKNARDLIEIFNCKEDNKTKLPCTVFLDRCGLARQVMPCPFSDYRTKKCVASVVGEAVNFKEKAFKRNIKSIINEGGNCS